MKKLLMTAAILAVNLAAIGQANFWNLNGSYMDCNTLGAGTLSSTSYPLYLYQADASSFAIPGLCETYCKLNYTPAGGRVITYKIDHITEGFTTPPSIPGFTSGSYNLGFGYTVYSDASSIAATKLKADRSRDVYAYTTGVILKIATISPVGAVSLSPTVLYSLPGPWTPNFDRWTAMEVTSDGNYLILGGTDAKSVVLFDLATNIPTTFNVPGGVHSRIQGYEYVKSPFWGGGVPRIYISYNDINASNPLGTGGIGYFDVGTSAFTNITSFPAGTSATGFGFSEIEFAKNNTLCMAYNTSLSYNFLNPGTVYALSNTGTWTTTTFSAAASDNVSYSAYCNKYYIQTQIDGENYDHGSYTAPTISYPVVKINNKSGAAIPSSSSPLIYRCGSDPLTLTATVSGLMKEYDVTVTAGTISGLTFTPTPGMTVSTTQYSYDNNISFNLVPSFVPLSYIGQPWRVEITPKGACASGAVSRTYYRTQNASVLADYYAYRTLLGGLPNNNKPLQTTPTISSAMPTGATLSAFKLAVASATGWAGASTAGVNDISVDAGANWELKVYEVDGTTGIRRQISGVDVPNASYLSGTSSVAGSLSFTDFSRGFDPSSSATGYVDLTTSYMDGYYYFVDYYTWAKSTSPAELTAFSAKTWCTEFTVTNSTGCTVVNRSFFRIASTSLTNGHTAKAVSDDAEILAEEDVEIRIFPNPTSQKAILMLPYGVNATEFLLMDNTGKSVFQNSKLQSGKNEINLENLSSGVYFYEIKVNNIVKHGKLVKQ